MVTNPYEEASSSRARGGGRIWLVALAPLVATVAWAAPLGGQGPTAELSYGTHHLVGRSINSWAVRADLPRRIRAGHAEGVLDVLRGGHGAKASGRACGTPSYLWNGPLVLSDGKVTLTETVTFEEAQPDEGYVLTATLHALDDDGSDRGAITVSGELFEASASIVPADDERVRYLVASFGPSSPPQSHRGNQGAAKIRRRNICGRRWPMCVYRIIVCSDRALEFLNSGRRKTNVLYSWGLLAHERYCIA